MLLLPGTGGVRFSPPNSTAPISALSWVETPSLAVPTPGHVNSPCFSLSHASDWPPAYCWKARDLPHGAFSEGPSGPEPTPPGSASPAPDPGPRWELTLAAGEVLVVADGAEVLEHEDGYGHHGEAHDKHHYPHGRAVGLWGQRREVQRRRRRVSPQQLRRSGCRQVGPCGHISPGD